jgi:hypothetical protein
MKHFRFIIRHLPALLALLLFCGGWAAQPLRLVLPEPVECTKTCCLDSGECCCLLAVEDHHDEHAPPAFKRLRNECASFSAATFSTKLPAFSLRLAAKPAPRFSETSLPPIEFAAPDILSFLLACEKSPRAPPQPAAL